MRKDVFDSRGHQNVGLRVSHVAHLNDLSVYLSIYRFPSLRGKELSLKYADTKYWIDLPADDLDSFIDMVELEKTLQGKTLRLLHSKLNVRTSSNATTNCVHLDKKRRN